MQYFLRIWIPSKGKPSINRSTYYAWLNEEGEAPEHRLKSSTIKKIDELFKGLATDIVANEGKGIFYAKNRLGMHDRIRNENENKESGDEENEDETEGSDNEDESDESDDNESEADAEVVL